MSGVWVRRRCGRVESAGARLRRGRVESVGVSNLRSVSRLSSVSCVKGESRVLRPFEGESYIVYIIPYTLYTVADSSSVMDRMD